MIVVVDERESVGSAYIALLEREGVCGSYFDYGAFREWIATANDAEISTVEAFLLGDAEMRVREGQDIRKRADAPVFALLDSKNLSDTLDLFDAGFDDVLTKPVHPREILARARSFRGRIERSGDQHDDAEIIMLSDGRDPIVGGEPLTLPRRERRILECLLQRRTSWCSKAHIFGWVYGALNDGFDESVVESHICRLRRRLRMRLGYDAIVSQRYLGYRIELRNAAGGQPRQAPRGASPVQMSADKLCAMELAGGGW